MKSTNPRFTVPNSEIENRIDSLLAQLSLEEKIDLLGGHPTHGGTKANEKIGLVTMKMADGPVGVHWWCESSTAYPASIAAAASFDRKLMYRVGDALGRDCRARGVHILLAPGVNIYRSALCGRNFEYLGEDPYLSAQLVIENIKGLQNRGVAATVKHYAVNYQEFDRNHVSSDVDERTLHEVYLPAFKAAIVNAGAGCVMTGYNLVNSVHCSEHDYLVNKVLKGDWGFKGVVMSDWVSTHSALAAAVGGLDLEMPTAKWFNMTNLLPLVQQGMVAESVIDDKVRRMLRLAVCFGWLENDQVDTLIPQEDPVAHTTALDAARGGFVLLRNEDDILPFDRKKIGTLAVVGFSAAEENICGGGSAWSKPNHLVTLLDGITAAAGEGVEIVHAPGPSVSRDWSSYARGGFVMKNGMPGLQAEIFANSSLEGDPACVRTDEKLSFDWGMDSPAEGIDPARYSVRWSAFVVVDQAGTYTFYVNGNEARYRLFIDSVCVVDMWDIDRNGTNTVEMVLETGKRYAVRCEMCNSGSSWVTMHLGFERNGLVDEEIRAAVDAAARADAVVLCTGFSKNNESEGYDRHFGIGPIQERLILECSDANKNAVVVLAAGGNVDMEPWIDRTKALLHIWYPGQEGGTAVGEILFGDVNPSGRLPATFEKRLEDRSSYNCYHDSDNDKRVTLADGIFGGYRHFDRFGIEPRFPFGFGLSYTTFELSNLRLSSPRITENETITVSVDVTNTGTRAGAQVVQMYIRDLESKLTRPVKELKGFDKTYLEAGATGVVTMQIDRSSLSYYDPDCHDWVYEKGEFLVMVGTSARDIVHTQLLTAR